MLDEGCVYGRSYSEGFTLKCVMRRLEATNRERADCEKRVVVLYDIRIVFPE